MATTGGRQTTASWTADGPCGMAESWLAATLGRDGGVWAACGVSGVRGGAVRPAARKSALLGDHGKRKEVRSGGKQKLGERSWDCERSPLSFCRGIVGLRTRERKGGLAGDRLRGRPTYDENRRRGDVRLRGQKTYQQNDPLTCFLTCFFRGSRVEIREGFPLLEPSSILQVTWRALYPRQPQNQPRIYPLSCTL